MITKVWVVVEELQDGRLHEIVGATPSEEYAENAVRQLKEVDKKGYEYRMYCTDYKP